MLLVQWRRLALTAAAAAAALGWRPPAPLLRGRALAPELAALLLLLLLHVSTARPRPGAALAGAPSQRGPSPPVAELGQNPLDHAWHSAWLHPAGHGGGALLLLRLLLRKEARREVEPSHRHTWRCLHRSTGPSRCSFLFSGGGVCARRGRAQPTARALGRLSSGVRGRAAS